MKEHPFTEPRSKFIDAGRNMIGFGAVSLICAIGLFVQNGMSPRPDMGMQMLFWYGGQISLVLIAAGGFLAMFGCLIDAIRRRPDVSGSAYASRSPDGQGYSRDGSGTDGRSDASNG